MWLYLIQVEWVFIYLNLKGSTLFQLRQKLADIRDLILTSYSLMFKVFSFISFYQSDLIGQVFEYDDDKVISSINIMRPVRHA